MSRAAEPKRRYHHGDLRAALVTAGLELTRTGGPDALGIREVTRVVGVTPTAAYRHFADRQALLTAVAERIQEAMADRMRAPRPRPVTALHAVGLGYLEFALDEPGWFATAFFGAGTTAPADRLPAPYSALVAALDAMRDCGALTERQRADAQWPCWSAVHGFAELALHGPLRGRPRPELDALAARTVDAIIAGLAR